MVSRWGSSTREGSPSRHRKVPISTFHCEAATSSGNRLGAPTEIPGFLCTLSWGGGQAGQPLHQTFAPIFIAKLITEPEIGGTGSRPRQNAGNVSGLASSQAQEAGSSSPLQCAAEMIWTCTACHVLYQICHRLTAPWPQRGKGSERHGLNVSRLISVNLAWLALTHKTEMFGEPVCGIAWYCQPDWMGHGQHPNLKMDMIRWWFSLCPRFSLQGEAGHQYLWDQWADVAHVEWLPLNPCAKFISGNIKIPLYFLPLLNTEIAQVFEIHPQRRQGPVYHV